MALNEVNILIVDDDEVDIMAIKRAFKKIKVANPVYIARDGVEALEKLRANEIPTPRVILIDINMPRMDGISCIKEIRADKELQRAIIFVLTTSKDEEDRIKAYDYNIAGYIIKSEIGGAFMNAVEMLDSYWKIVELPDQ